MADGDNSHLRAPDDSTKTISYTKPTYEGYEFPQERLITTLRDPTKTPLVLVACGSFSPITHLHLRIFEMASDFCRQEGQFEVMGGYLSAVSDAYKKQGLAPAKHRVHMCQVACEQTSSWLQTDTWEPFCQEYLPTAKVLDHFNYQLNQVVGGAKITNEKGEEVGRKPYRVALLAGSDLIMTMSEPGVWAPEDLDHILGKYGTFIVERAGTDIDAALSHLQTWRDNIYVIRQLIQNDVSSTKIRNFLKQGMSVLYLIPGSVINYIVENGLYVDDYNAKTALTGAQTMEKFEADKTKIDAKVNGEYKAQNGSKVANGVAED